MKLIGLQNIALLRIGGGVARAAEGRRLTRTDEGASGRSPTRAEARHFQTSGAKVADLAFDEPETLLDLFTCIKSEHVFLG